LHITVIIYTTGKISR